jgi:putative spermidine/putrescine transport system permease protein
MTAIAQHATVRPRAAALSLRRLMPAFLLAPCLAWIFFFFLLPLALMCWRSLASEGFSFAAYSELFTSPLYTKVMLTTVRTACITTVAALILAYPMAYALTMSGGKLRAFILVFVFIPYWVDIIVRSFPG